MFSLPPSHERRAAKQSEMTLVERREAQRQSHLARAALARLRRWTDRKVHLTGVSQTPRRLPKLHRVQRASQLGRIELRRESVSARE